MEVPRALHFLPNLPIIYSKRSWHMAFDDRNMSTTFTFVGDEISSVLPSMLTARELFPSEPPAVTFVEVFNSPPSAKSKRLRKSTKAPIVDTSVRRCTRSTAKNAGFKASAFQELPTQPKKKKPKSKPLEMAPTPSAHQPKMPNTESYQQQKQHTAVIPPTPIKVMQDIGVDLQITASLLTKEQLTANPNDSISHTY